MDQAFLHRPAGLYSNPPFESIYTNHLFNTLQPSPAHIFHRKHATAVNALTFSPNGRNMLAGTANGVLTLWDLTLPTPIKPIQTVKPAHSFSITSLAYIPSLPFLSGPSFTSTSFDNTLKHWPFPPSSKPRPKPLSTLAFSNTKVFTHAVNLNPNSPNLGSAICAVEDTAGGVRIANLKTGAKVQTLMGHRGSVYSVAWSPVDPFLVVSGGADGTVRVWDVRRAGGILCMLGSEGGGVKTGVGVGGRGKGAGLGKAHDGAVNGISFTETGRYLVTTGKDDKVKVWDLHTGEDTHVHFGPLIRNKGGFSCQNPVIVPRGLTASEQVWVMADREVLGFEVHTGRMVKRVVFAERVFSLEHRPVEAEIYAGNAIGEVKVLRSSELEPKTQEEEEEEERELLLQEGTELGRDTLGRIKDELMGQAVTFT